MTAQKCLSIFFAIATALSLSALPANAQYWQEWFSEEDGGLSESCATGINGMECKGWWCDERRFSCDPSLDALVDPAASTWTNSFRGVIPNDRMNLDTGNFFAACPAGSIVTGMECKGGYCGQGRLKCAKLSDEYTVPDPDARLTVVFETPYDWRATTRSNCWQHVIDEDAAHISDNSSGQRNALTALFCRGSGCTSYTGVFCPVTKKPAVIGPAKGDWEVVCSGGNDCQATIEQGVSTSTELASEWSREFVTRIEATIKAGVEVDWFTGESSITAETSQSTSQASRVVRGYSANAASTCNTSVDMVENGIHAVYQWVVNSTVNGESVKIRTCMITCRANTQVPDYLPDDPKAVGSCASPSGMRLTSQGVTGHNLVQVLVPTGFGPDVPYVLRQSEPAAEGGIFEPDWIVHGRSDPRPQVTLSVVDRGDSYVHLMMESGLYELRINLATKALEGRYSAAHDRYSGEGFDVDWGPIGTASKRLN